MNPEQALAEIIGIINRAPVSRLESVGINAAISVIQGLIDEKKKSLEEEEKKKANKK